MGSPAKVIRKLNEEEIASIKESAEDYIALNKNFNREIKYNLLQKINLIRRCIMKIKAPRTFLMFIVVVSFFCIKVFAKDRNPEVHFIDTGQSDCILIKTGKENYLIDTGWEYYSGKILSYLNSNNVDKIDGVILTHYHDDHYGGLEMLLKTSKVKKILPKHNSDDKKKVN